MLYFINLLIFTNNYYYIKLAFIFLKFKFFSLLRSNALISQYAGFRKANPFTNIFWLMLLHASSPFG